MVNTTRIRNQAEYENKMLGNFDQFEDEIRINLEADKPSWELYLEKQERYQSLVNPQQNRKKK